MGVQFPQDEGNIRKIGVPDLKMNKDGTSTEESMTELKGKLSEKVGHGTKVVLTCQTADSEKIKKYAEGISNNKDRPKYNWNPFNSNQCRDFSVGAMKSG